jgi:hypothetical protein
MTQMCMILPPRRTSRRFVGLRLRAVSGSFRQVSRCLRSGSQLIRRKLKQDKFTTMEEEGKRMCLVRRGFRRAGEVEVVGLMRGGWAIHID